MKMKEAKTGEGKDAKKKTTKGARRWRGNRGHLLGDSTGQEVGQNKTTTRLWAGDQQAKENTDGRWMTRRPTFGRHITTTQSFKVGMHFLWVIILSIDHLITFNYPFH